MSSLVGASCCSFHEKLTRTEAQQRGALHSHILLWYAKRDLKTNYRALEGIPRSVPGNDCKQRSKNSVVPPLPERDYSEDNIYHHHQVGRIWCPRGNIQSAAILAISVAPCPCWDTTQSLDSSVRNDKTPRATFFRESVGRL